MDEFPNSSTAILCLLMSSFIIHATSAANHYINSSHIIRDGETLVSSAGIFQLGFFSPGNSTRRYVGVWHNNLTLPTYVWVANRQNPLTTKSGVLRLIKPGVLALLDHSGSIVWSSSASTSLRNPTARLLDSGNLVVNDADDERPENFAWQSFDHPSDTYLPGMMSLGWDLVTGVETYMSSWRSHDDPSPGEFTAHLDPTGYPQIVVRRAGGDIRFRLGPWNGIRFSGAPDTSHDPMNKLMLRMNKYEVRYMEHIVDPSALIRSTLDTNGVVPRYTWNYHTQSWAVYTSKPVDNCDSYGVCGANGVCSIGDSPSCLCLDKFVPRNLASWSRADWSDGCIRRWPVMCKGDVFLNYSGIKLPDSRNSTFSDLRERLSECREECSRNCSCTAYTQLDIREGGGGCLFYYGDLIDIKTIARGGQNLYIRMASTELDVVDARGGKGVIAIASSISAAVALLVCLGLVLIYTRKRNKHFRMRNNGPFSHGHGERAELPFFKLSTILKATHHFSEDHRLGEGGFGAVYKGMLEDGQEIAVKRLSKASMQGVEELKNEVFLITKLQHRNLVKLLGCCIEREENMLIYEYMPNKSLDFFLFDETKRMLLLDWRKRFHIINGIAKGLLYLHQDSRLRIVHRDLKASNILLDADMNPKISDFGLARSFGGNETEAKTRRVVGTHGYMSPEYAIHGLFSIKSDVFSFGVLVLEVVSGKRNRGFFLKDQNLNLLGHAWTAYKEEKLYKLVDTCLGNSFDLSQALRSIHVGLLCVQKCAEDRPSMSSVVFMLGNEVALPEAKQPGFFGGTEVHVSSTPANSENQVTITWPGGR